MPALAFWPTVNRSRLAAALSPWNTDSRARTWQTVSQLLPAAANHTRRRIHTPAASRCVLHCTDGRRPGRIDQDQLDTRPEALRFEQLSVFCIKQPGEHMCALRAELRHRLLLRREVEGFGDDGFARVACPSDGFGQCVRQHLVALP